MSGHLIPPVWTAEQIAEIVSGAGSKWGNLDTQFMAVAVCLAECDGFINSYNDNMSDDGKTILSRDVGMWEINIPASKIGTAYEKSLYDPKTNAAAAYKLWIARGWEPWASYTSGVVFDDRYVMPALLGVMNHAAVFAVQSQKKFPARKTNHTLTSPFISIPQLRKLYPDAPV